MSPYEFCPRCDHECYDHGVYCMNCGLDLDKVAHGRPRTKEELVDLP